MQLLLPVHVIHDTAVIVSHKKRVFAEAEDIGGAAVDLAQLEEAGDEIAPRSAGADSYDFITAPQGLLCRSV